MAAVTISGVAGIADRPGGGTDVSRGCTVPLRAADHIVAVGQRRDAATTDMIPIRAADETARLIHWTDSTDRPVDPCRRACLDRRGCAEERAADHVVAVGQGRDSTGSDVVEIDVAEEAVVHGDRAGRWSGAVDQRHRTDVGDESVVPHGTADHVTIVGQRRDAATADVVGVTGADEAVERRHRGARDRLAAGPRDRSGVEHELVVPLRAVTT